MLAEKREKSSEIVSAESVISPPEKTLPAKNPDLASLTRLSFNYLVAMTPKPPPLPNLDNVPGTSSAPLMAVWKDSLSLHRTVLEALKDSFSIMASQSKTLLTGTLIASGFAAAVPLAAAKLSSYIPDLLSGKSGQEGFTASAARMTSRYLESFGLDLNTGAAAAFLVVAVTGVLYAKAGFASSISRVASNLFAPTVERAVRLELSKATGEMGYEHSLSARNKDRSLLVSQGLWAYPQFFNGSLTCTISAVALASTATTFFALPGSGYLGVGLIASAIPVALSGTLRNIEKIWMERKLTYQQRESWQARGAVSDPEAVALFRHFRSLEPMRRRYEEIDVKQSNSEAILEKRQLWTDGLLNVHRVAVTAGASFVALQYHIPGEPISSTLYALGMVALFQGSLYGLAQETSSLLNLAAKLDPFYKLRDEISQPKKASPELRLTAQQITEAPTIIIKNLTKSFPVINEDGTQDNGPEVINIPELTIESGQTIGICGKIGSGKSVFGQLLAGRLSPTGGSILWRFSDGAVVDTADVLPDDIERINARLQQGGYSFERLTIREILELALNKNPDSRYTIDDLLVTTNLASIVKSAPDGLDTKIGYGWIKEWIPSGGKGHVINLMQIVLSDCPVVLLDEPTADLDTEQKRNFTDVIIPLLKLSGKTVVVVSHTFGDLSYADRVLVFHEGKIADDGSPAELSRRPGYYKVGNLDEINRALAAHGKMLAYNEAGELEILAIPARH
jgi:ABC-type multidrug transport system fused ATPase/permease subunit